MFYRTISSPCYSWYTTGTIGQQHNRQYVQGIQCGREPQNEYEKVRRIRALIASSKRRTTTAAGRRRMGVGTHVSKLAPVCFVSYR